LAERARTRRRVLIVGLDGATFDVILPMIEKGRLPVLAHLMESGAWGKLRSTLPPLSPVAWSSFLTGKNPGRHGVFGFEEVEAGSYEFRPTAATRAGQRSLWRIVSDHGRRVVALDIPFSHPPEAVNGLLVAGYGAPVGEGVEFTHPRELRAELARRFGEFAVAVPQRKAYPPDDELFWRWDRILDNRARISDFLLRREKWDVFMIVLGVTDHVQHGAWTYFEPMHRDSHRPDAARWRERLFLSYEKADAFIGRLLEGADSSTHVVVLSDHGFGTTWRGQLTRRILAEAGWLRYRGLFGGPIMDFLHRAYDALPWLKKTLHRRPTERRRLKGAAARAIAWPHTAAFPAAMGWQVYVNARGAFPYGFVEPGEPYRALCREIADRLESAVAPGTNQPLVRHVWQRDEVFEGDAVPRAPDLLIEYQNLHGVARASEAADWDLVGSHTMDGVLIMAGPDIRATQLPDAQIIEVAPTVLHLMGLPVPRDMDGAVRVDALRDGALCERPIAVERGAALTESVENVPSPSEVASVREQLRNLGYLE